MKLSIDTKEDSFEDIRKVLQILTSILEKKDSSRSAFSSSPSSADTTNLMSMFSDAPAKGTVETAGNPPDFSSFLNLTQKKEQKDDDEGRIEYY
ncbi:MAG: hypothetical protein Q8R47_02730 [Nanoarchaeota archaeon]|nr:hypothetical protein [Nanoarchaeota archaeon]